MTNPPYGTAPGGQWLPPGPPTTQAPAWAPAAPRQSRAPVIISLVIAIVAVAVAIGAWFKPSSEITPPADSAPKYSADQISDAKAALCTAHLQVNRATASAGGQKSDDPTLDFVISVNIRLAATVSANYFLAKINQFPAAPNDLIESLRELAMTYQSTVLLQLADAPKSELDIAYDEINSADAKVVEACK